MNRIIARHVLIAILAGATALPAVAEPTKPTVAENVRASHRTPAAHGGNAELRLADRLATLETYIGITPKQAPAWRSYANALQAFARSSHPEPGDHPWIGRDIRPPQVGSHEPSQRQTQSQRTLMGERMAEQALANGRTAEDLHSAAATLRAELSPEQLTRLIEVEAPPRRMHPSGPGPSRSSTFR